MSIRITSKGNHFPVLNVMKCSLNCLLVSYLSCSLLLTIVMAAPEVGPIDTQMGHKLHPNSNSAVSMDKRAAPRQYNFGIGKKSDYSADVMEDNSEDSDEGYGPDYNKRGAEQSRFAFGLGKRAKPNEQRFSFGLGKRATQRDNRFAFGLGKRENNFDEYNKRRYSFGLGKRTPLQESLHNYYSEERR